MNPRLEDFLRRYRERYGAAGCRVDDCTDEHVVRCHRRVMVDHARRAIRRSMPTWNQAMGREVHVGTPLERTWRITFGDGLKFQGSGFRITMDGQKFWMAPLRQRLTLSDFQGTIIGTFDSNPIPGLQSRLDDSLRPRRLTDWLRRSFEQAREPIREAITRPYEGKGRR